MSHAAEKSFILDCCCCFSRPHVQARIIRRSSVVSVVSFAVVSVVRRRLFIPDSTALPDTSSTRPASSRRTLGGTRTSPGTTSTARTGEGGSRTQASPTPLSCPTACVSIGRLATNCPMTISKITFTIHNHNSLLAF